MRKIDYIEGNFNQSIEENKSLKYSLDSMNGEKSKMQDQVQHILQEVERLHQIL